MGISTILLIITLISIFSLFKGIQNKKKLSYGPLYSYYS